MEISLLIPPTSTFSIVASCLEHKNCSLQVDNIYLNCWVGHKSECREAKNIIGQTERFLHDPDLLPYLSSIEIFERVRDDNTLRFQFSLPQTDIGDDGKVSGVLAEFSEHESKDRNPHYSHTDPICRYFDFLNSSIPKKEINRHRINISYDCIGLDLSPSAFVLSLQSVPTSYPLVYTVSFMHHDEPFIDDYTYIDLPEDYYVWSHRLIAVANIAPPGSALGSLHVIFEPAQFQVRYHDVTLISESDGKEVQSKFFQASNPPEKIVFEKVKPGNYNVKVEVSDYICEIDPLRCEPLLSHNVIVKGQESRAMVATEDHSVDMWALLATVLGVVIPACVLMILLMCAIRHRKKKPKKLIIDLISLADRDLERLMSINFSEFLTEALGAHVNFVLPYMPKNGDTAEDQRGTIAEDCATPTGSDDPLLHKPIWMTQNNYRPTSGDYTVVLDFYYGSHEMESHGLYNTSSVQQINTHQTKNLPRLSLELRQAFDNKNSNSERILCVTFAHQIIPDVAPSVISSPFDPNEQMSSYTGGGKSCTVYSEILAPFTAKETKDTVSLNNHFNPDSFKTTIFGIPVLQYFLPADTQKLYSKLTSSKGLLDSEHSVSLIKALEVYKKAKEQPFHVETFDDSTSQTESVATVNNFQEIFFESSEPQHK